MILFRVSSIAVILVVSSFLLGLCIVAGQTEQLGKQLYEKHCLKCHGVDGNADTKIGRLTKTPDLNKRPWKSGESLEDLVKLIREGEGKMPKYVKKMNEEEITSVARYTLDLFDIKEN